MAKQAPKAKNRAQTTSHDSTCITRITHNPSTKNLDVTFRDSGAQYRYRGVSAKVATSLRRSDSVGSHYNRNVKHEYPWQKLSAGFKGRRKTRKKGGR